MEREPSPPPPPLKPCFPGLAAVGHSEEGKREREMTTTQERRHHHQRRQHEQEERMKRRQQQQQQQQQQQRQQQRQRQSASAWRRPQACPGSGNNKKRDPLLCKCLAAMGMCRFVDDFDNFTQFIRMSSDQCRLYGPEFVVKYAKLHAGIEALCASAFSMYNDFEPHDAACCCCCDVDGEPVAAGASAASAATVPIVAATQGKNLPENAEEFFACNDDDDKDDRGCEGCGDRVWPRPPPPPPPPLRRSDALGPGRGGLVPCTEVFDLFSGDGDGQATEVCSHVVGTCDAHEKWVRRNLQN